LKNFPNIEKSKNKKKRRKRRGGSLPFSCFSNYFNNNY